MGCPKAIVSRGRSHCSAGSKTMRSRWPKDSSRGRSGAKRVKQDSPRGPLRLAVFGRHAVCAVGELSEVVIPEEDRVYGTQAQEEAEGEVADLALRVCVSPHLDDVPQGSHVSREDHRGFRLVRKQRASGLLYFLPRV